MAWGPRWLHEPLEWEKRLVSESPWHDYSKAKRRMWLGVLAVLFLVMGAATLVVLGASIVEAAVITVVVGPLFFGGLVPIVLARDEAALRSLRIARNLVLACFAIVLLLNAVELIASVLLR